MPGWVVILPELDKIGTNTVIEAVSTAEVEEATTVKTVSETILLILKLTIPFVLEETT